MMHAVILLLICFQFSDTTYLYDDLEPTARSRIVRMEDIDFQPVVPKSPKHSKKFMLTKNIECEEFNNYAVNCTMESALIYNSSRKSPPMPGKMNDWCKAIRHLTNCAIDWNSECKDVTERHFNEESIKGHMHVVKNICDDELFLSGYDDLPVCIDTASRAWEICYIEFKMVVEHQKNITQDWTHFDTHFVLCCARTLFRRCTLTTLFENPDSKCSRDHAVILQKFSVIISEGDVFQDCDRNVMYSNCPGGDPRPPSSLLSNLMNAPLLELAATDHAREHSSSSPLLLLMLIFITKIL